MVNGELKNGEQYNGKQCNGEQFSGELKVESGEQFSGELKVESGEFSTFNSPLSTSFSFHLFFPFVYNSPFTIYH